MKKMLSILVIDSVIFEKYKSKGLCKFKKNGKSFAFDSIESRITEQIVNFMKFNYIFYPQQLIFFIFINGCPIFFSSFFRNFQSQKSQIKKNLKFFQKLIKERLKLLFIDQEIEKLKNSTLRRNFFLNLSSIFFIIYNTRKKLSWLEINIFNLVSKKNLIMNQKILKESLSLCKRLNCTFNFLTFEKNIPFLKFLALFSNGFCSKPFEKMVKILYCDKFFQLLINLFWVKKLSRECSFKVIQTKLDVFKDIFLSAKEIWQCGFCKNVFTILLSNCNICGSKYLF